jgi:hypothetical protein
MSTQQSTNITTIVGLVIVSISICIFGILICKTKIRNFNEDRNVSGVRAVRDYCKYVICCRNETKIHVEDTSEFIRFKKNVELIFNHVYAHQINLTRHGIIEMITEINDKPCSICIEPLSNIVCKPPCSHLCHKSCLIEWLRAGNNNCASCSSVIIK